jgi:hypothetical protein
MMKRILKRPMFRMGGDVENVGIMDGMRARYKAGAGVQIPGMKEGSTEIVMDYSKTGSVPTSMPTTADDRLKRRLNLINSLTAGPNLNQFLIDFGLNLASGPPRGNIISTAAMAARDPFQRFMAGQQAADKTKAALAIEALDDDDTIVLEKQARLMANNPKSPYYKDFDGALNALSQAKLSQASEFRKEREPTAQAEANLVAQGFDANLAKFAAPYAARVVEIKKLNPNAPFDYSDLFLDGRRVDEYDASKVYIDPINNKVVRYNPNEKRLIPVEDVKLPDIGR